MKERRLLNTKSDPINRPIKSHVADRLIASARAFYRWPNGWGNFSTTRSYSSGKCKQACGNYFWLGGSKPRGTHICYKW